MGLGSLFRSRVPIEDFARSLVDDISKRYPVAIDQDATARPTANRLTRIVEDVCQKAVDFKGQHKLGVLGKAKLGNAFRWELSSRGYRKEFVDIATEAVIVHISRPTSGT
jgi:hypothetical protein